MTGHQHQPRHFDRELSPGCDAMHDACDCGWVEPCGHPACPYREEE